MSNKTKRKKISRLAREILSILGISTAISVFVYIVLEISSTAMMLTYCDRTGRYLSQIQEITAKSWIKSLSFGAAVLFFVVLFLFLLGQKLSYLRNIIEGVESLRMHRMNFEMPLEGENEFTELAQSINYLAETERSLMEKETKLRQEKESLLRSLSHDIRTPLTAILSYSEYMMRMKENDFNELMEFAQLINRKGQQIKELTDRLLDNGKRSTEYIEDGNLLIEQLTQEWLEMLEDDFICDINLQNCTSFSGEFDIQELRRIFDNLSSNIIKYADSASPVQLMISADKRHIVIEQVNRKKALTEGVESRNIGLSSIRQIARSYSGEVDITDSENEFHIKITLSLQNSSELPS